MEPRTVNRFTRITRVIAAALAASVGALALVVVAPAAAQAATSDVSATCTTLDVKLRTFADRGEVSILLDGEYQTDGTADGWQSVGTSFTRSYAFEPVVAHTYTVRVNSFDPDSGGASFTPGTGADAEYSATTHPCSPVSVAAVGSSCVSDKRIDKQTLSLEITGLRARVTYLVEVLDESGEITDHFQFRTAPVVNKTFSGLTAGQTYRVRVTDQSNDVLSGGTTATLVGCAAPASLENAVASCVGGTGRIVADVEGLVPGRAYTASLSPSAATLRLAPSSANGVITFTGVPRGDYVVTLDDDDAPLSARAAVTVAECGTGAESGGNGSGGTGESAGGSAGSGSTGASAAPGSSTSNGGGSPAVRSGGGRSGAMGGATSVSATFTEAVTLGLSPAVSPDGAVDDTIDTSDASGPGDDGSYASGSVADELSSAPSATETVIWPWVLAGAGVLAALALIALALLRRRRTV